MIVPHLSALAPFHLACLAETGIDGQVLVFTLAATEQSRAACVAGLIRASALADLEFCLCYNVARNYLVSLPIFPSEVQS